LTLYQAAAERQGKLSSGDTAKSPAIVRRFISSFHPSSSISIRPTLSVLTP